MANTEKIVVQVVVQGDKDLKRLEGRTKTTTKSIAKMTVGIAAAVAAFRQMSQVVSESIKSFRDFEFQMAKTKAVTNASDEDFKLLSDSAKELGRSTFFTAQQVAELQTNYGKLGFTTQEILDAQEATLQLAIATDSDLGRATIVAGAAVKGFGLDIKETTRVVDVMTAAFAASPLDIEKWQTSMTKVAPIAGSAGISIEATAAVMGVLADSGHEASIAGTSLRNIFLKMLNPTSELAKQVGFTVHSADDLIIAFQRLNAAGLDNERISEIVDVRQEAIFRTMLKNTAEIEKQTNAYNNAAGTAKRMAAIIGDTLEGDFKRLTSASEGLRIELIEKLGKGMSRIIKRFTQLFSWLTKNQDATIKWIETIVNVVKWIGLYRLGVLAATKATAAWRIATTLLNSTLTITRGALAKTGIGLLAVALGELGFRYLTASEDGEEFNDTQKKINKETEKQLQLSEEALKSMGRIGKKTQDEIDAEEQAKRDARFAKEQEDLQNNFTEQMSKLKERLKNGLDTQEEFDEKAFAKEQLHLANMLGLYERYGQNTADINAQILDNELNRIETVAEAEQRAFREQQDIKQSQLGLAVETADAIISITTQNLNRQAERDTKLLEERKEAGLITQEQYEAGVEKIQRKAFEQKKKMALLEILVETAAAVAKIKIQAAILLANPFTALAAPAALAQIPFAIASGLVQAAVIQSQKYAKGGMIEEYANGGMVQGKSHAQGGEKFAVGGRVVELEGGEAVINKRSTAMFRNQLSAMNAAGGGVKFADGGMLNMPSFTQQQFNAVGQNQMMGAMNRSSKVVVVEADITDTQNSVNVIESDAII
tara:strand:+ start:11010 stop:13490 length:2481 start_codon:yes stop_codon:yes gene_type:complete